MTIVKSCSCENWKIQVRKKLLNSFNGAKIIVYYLQYLLYCKKHPVCISEIKVYKLMTVRLNKINCLFAFRIAVDMFVHLLKIEIAK